MYTKLAVREPSSVQDEQNMIVEKNKIRIKLHTYNLHWTKSNYTEVVYTIFNLDTAKPIEIKHLLFLLRSDTEIYEFIREVQPRTTLAPLDSVRGYAIFQNDFKGRYKKFIKAYKSNSRRLVIRGIGKDGEELKFDELELVTNE